LSARFKQYALDSEDVLKSGIKTKSPLFNKVISKVEQVCLRSTKPMLLTGPTGAGKSKLAKQIYELRTMRHRIGGPFVEVNCATLRGDNAMSALFGHKKGSFTGAMSDRPGLLKTADKGLLFLDEIGTLNLDEQAMLLRALEHKSFMPVGFDTEITSDFQLIAGTNLDLSAEVAKGTFRSDLLARIRPWSFKLPSLAERKEDIEPNLDYELDCISSEMNCRVSFNKAARERYLRFALQAPWPENFRDFSNSVMRMATLSEGGRILEADVEAEIAELTERWSAVDVPSSATPLVDRVLPGIEADLFERAQIEVVLSAIKNTTSMAGAGKVLFSVSREKRTTKNDSHRVRTLLLNWGLDHQQLKADLQSVPSKH
jgi:transcriptional regulatory protein RtcR